MLSSSLPTIGKPAPISPSFIWKLPQSSAAAKTKPAPRPLSSHHESGHGALGDRAHRRKETKTTPPPNRNIAPPSRPVNGGARAWVNLAGFYRHTNRFDDMEQALRTMESSPLDRPAALGRRRQHLTSHRPRLSHGHPSLAPLHRILRYRRGSSRLQGPLSARRVVRETR